jgi:uncharacterized protein YjbI with pentapeptide repeats
MVNKYVRQLLGGMFQGKQAQRVVRVQPQHLPTSPEEWHQHWQSQSQPWRTEPGIDAKRQEELSKRRAINPDIEKGIYPFKGMKLSRADVEWLLATHENGHGPVDWSDESQRKRRGLDLRGADLSHEDLSGLPLARISGGLHLLEGIVREMNLTDEQRNAAIMFLNETNLKDAQLEGAELYFAEMNGATFVRAHMENAELGWAQLKKAEFGVADLKGATLNDANLEEANFMGADLEGADLEWSYSHVMRNEVA